MVQLSSDNITVKKWKIYSPDRILERAYQWLPVGLPVVIRGYALIPTEIAL